MTLKTNGIFVEISIVYVRFTHLYETDTTNVFITLSTLVYIIVTSYYNLFACSAVFYFCYTSIVYSNGLNSFLE